MTASNATLPLLTSFAAPTIKSSSPRYSQTSIIALKTFSELPAFPTAETAVELPILKRDSPTIPTLRPILLHMAYLRCVQSSG